MRLTNHFHLVPRLKRVNCVSKTPFKLVPSWRVNRQLDLLYDLSVDDLIISLKGRKFNCITSFSSQNQQVTAVRAQLYQVKYWRSVTTLFSDNILFPKFPAYCLRIQLPRIVRFFTSIFMHQNGLPFFDDAFYCCRRNVCPYRRKSRKYTCIFKWMLSFMLK